MSAKQVQLLDLDPAFWRWIEDVARELRPILRETGRSFNDTEQITSDHAIIFDDEEARVR